MIVLQEENSHLCRTNKRIDIGVIVLQEGNNHLYTYFHTSNDLFYKISQNGRRPVSKGRTQTLNSEGRKRAS